MHQAHLSWCSLTSKYTKHPSLSCLSPLKASYLPFMLSLDLQKHQPYFLCSFQTFKYVKSTFIHTFLLLNASCIRVLFQFNLQKLHWYFVFGFFIAVDLIHCFFWGLETLNTLAVPCFFVYSIQNNHCYLSASSLTSKRISGTLFLLCLWLNIFFVPFCGILTCKYIKLSYLVAFSTLNTPSTPYLFVYNP